MTNGDMDITYDMLENINSILPKISNVSPIGKIYTKSTERKLKRKANFKAKSNISNSLIKNYFVLQIIKLNSTQYRSWQIFLLSCI